ncbi:MAG: hypothetical protein DMG39_23135 [Acidobacteria bacterium]|nr:MAG: hypothetical protein DMG39_23135 [Acidobacteriota bacterium]
MLFWTTADLENKLLDFTTYFNKHRTHNSLEGQTPDTPTSRPPANLHSFRWQPHCRALIRPRWLPDLSKTRARCGISRPRQLFQRNHSVFRNYRAFRGISSFTPTGYGATYNRFP